MQQARAGVAAAVGQMAGQDGENAGFFSRTLAHWKRVAHAIGVVQTRLLMIVLYAALVVPTGLLMRLFRDPLHLRRRSGSNWTPAHSPTPSLEAARRQF